MRRKPSNHLTALRFHEVLELATVLLALVPLAAVPLTVVALVGTVSLVLVSLGVESFSWVLVR